MRQRRSSVVAWARRAALALVIHVGLVSLSACGLKGALVVPPAAATASAAAAASTAAPR
ncbi:MAG: hypothetical protein ABI330_05540 [Caldimonas sp.]|nr:sugar transporter [Pseudomonadota bacterium]